LIIIKMNNKVNSTHIFISIFFYQKGSNKASQYIQQTQPRIVYGNTLTKL